MGLIDIHDAVRTGRITPAQGAMLLEMRAELRRARHRREVWQLFWRAFFDGMSLGPLRRWIAMRFRK